MNRALLPPALLLSASLAVPAWGLNLGPSGCEGGDPIAPPQVIEGDFDSSLQGSYVMVPIDVPAGTTAVRIKYCWDLPEGPTTGNAKHTVDLGLWDPPPVGETWGPPQFRGWG